MAEVEATLRETRELGARRGQPRAETGTALLLLAPSVAFLFLMTIIPMVYSLWLSFQNYSLMRPDLVTFYGLGNYAEILRDSVFWEALRVTVVFTISVVVLEFVLGFLIASLLDRQMRGMGLVRTFLIIPVFISPVAMGLTWRYMFQPSYGLINYLLGLVGLPRLDWVVSTTWALPAVVLVDVWQWTPFVVLILLAGMQSISPEITEAADLDGLTRWQYLRRIVLPMIQPVILVIGLIRIIDSIKVFDLIYIMTRGGPATATYALSIHTYIKAFQMNDMGQSAALAWIIVVLVNIFTFIFLRMLSREQA